MRFAAALCEPTFAPREALAGRDPRTLAREILQTTPEELSRAFKGSPKKRAKLRGLGRNAAVVLGRYRITTAFHDQGRAHGARHTAVSEVPLPRQCR